MVYSLLEIPGFILEYSCGKTIRKYLYSVLMKAAPSLLSQPDSVTAGFLHSLRLMLQHLYMKYG